MKKLALALLAVTLPLNLQANGFTELLNFGSSTFSIDTTFTQDNFSQSSTSVTFGTISSLDAPNNTIFGTFTPADWSSFNLSNFQINVSLSGSNSAPLSIELYGSGATTLLATSGAVGIPTPTSNTYFSIPLTLEAGQNLTSVDSFLLKVNNTGAIPLTVNSFAAVPEPGTYALMAIAGVFLMVTARRRASTR